MIPYSAGKLGRFAKVQICADVNGSSASFNFVWVGSSSCRSLGEGRQGTDGVVGRGRGYSSRQFIGSSRWEYRWDRIWIGVGVEVVGTGLTRMGGICGIEGGFGVVDLMVLG